MPGCSVPPTVFGSVRNRDVSPLLCFVDSGFADEPGSDEAGETGIREDGGSEQFDGHDRAGEAGVTGA